MSMTAETGTDTEPEFHPRPQIFEQAVAEGPIELPARPAPVALFSDAAVPVVEADTSEVAIPDAEASVVPAEAPADPSELLALGIDPQPVPAKKRLGTKRFSLIDPNQMWVMWIAVVLLGGILFANLAASFTSVYASAAFIGLPTAVQWLPVVILDVAIVGFSWALMVFSTRLADPRDLADKTLIREKTGRTRLYLIFVTAFSVASNLMHTYDHWKGDITSPQAIYGVVFSACIPIMSLVATEELIRLVFIRRRKVQEESE